MSRNCAITTSLQPENIIADPGSITQSRWYRISEDKAATTTFSDFFAPGGQLILAGQAFNTPESIVAVKQNLLPPNGNKAWWHLIQGSTLVADDTKTQTVSAKIIIQTTYTPGNCSQAQ